MAILQRQTTVLTDNAPPCTDAHCSLVSCGVNCTCKKNGWDVGHWVTVCDFDGNCCSCKCSCLLYGTPVATPDGERKIEEFTVGEQVLACDTDFNWSPYDVGFSDGTSGDVVEALMVEVDTGVGAPLQVTRDHVFLVAGDGGGTQLKRAIDLTVDDTLFDPEGNPVAIAALDTSPVPGGIWHIATILEQPKSPNGHLLNTQGIVSGDYALQLWFDEMPKKYVARTNGKIGDEAFVRRHRADRPEQEIGDWLTEYHGSGRAGADEQPGAMLLNSSTRRTVAVPRQSAAFLTNNQAARVRRTPQRPYDDPSTIDGVRYLFTLYRAFYPGIDFVLDWSSHDGNGYAVRTLDRPVILLQGGLLRAEPVRFEATSLIIGQLIGYVSPASHTDKKGYACKTEADYFAVQAAMRQVWYSTMFGPTTIAAITQVQALFDAMKRVKPDAEEAADGCVEPALKCRIDTYKAALALMPPPSCAGGPDARTLRRMAKATVMNCPPCPA